MTILVNRIENRTSYMHKRFIKQNHSANEKLNISTKIIIHS